MGDNIFEISQTKEEGLIKSFSVLKWRFIIYRNAFTLLRRDFLLWWRRAT